MSKRRALDYELEAAHKKSLRNRAALTESGKGACFYCLAEFAFERIDEWVDDDNTALCPSCKVDSVLSFTTGTADKAFLQKMHDYWFAKV